MRIRSGLIVSISCCILWNKKSTLRKGQSKMIRKAMVCMMASAVFSMFGCSADDQFSTVKTAAEPEKSWLPIIPTAATPAMRRNRFRRAPEGLFLKSNRSRHIRQTTMPASIRRKRRFVQALNRRWRKKSRTSISMTSFSSERRTGGAQWRRRC